MFYSNYIILCNKIGKAPSAVAEENGFKRSVVTRWSKGAIPRQANIQKLADYFGVPVSELIGEPEQKESPGPEAEGLSEVDNVTAELMSLWRAASPEQKQLYLKILKAMEDEHAEK